MIHSTTIRLQAIIMMIRLLMIDNGIPTLLLFSITSHADFIAKYHHAKKSMFHLPKTLIDSPKVIILRIYFPKHQREKFRQHRTPHHQQFRLRPSLAKETHIVLTRHQHLI